MLKAYSSKSNIKKNSLQFDSHTNYFVIYCLSFNYDFLIFPFVFILCKKKTSNYMPMIEFSTLYSSCFVIKLLLE